MSLLSGSPSRAVQNKPYSVTLSGSVALVVLCALNCYFSETKSRYSAAYCVSVEFSRIDADSALSTSTIDEV